MASKNKYKKMNFDTVEDYQYAMNLLIDITYKNLKRYKYYWEQLSDYSLELLRQDTKYIPEKTYIEWNDKNLASSHAILMCFVDDVDTGFSWLKFRRMISQSSFASLLDPLEEEYKVELDELRDIRNWSFHLSQSNFIASREMFEKGIAEELRQFITFSPNPIVVSTYEWVSSAFIASLHIHMGNRYDVFAKLYMRMLRDYEKLIGQKVQVIERAEPPRDYTREVIGIPQLSMAMQKKKYDGSQESFDKITLKELFEPKSNNK